MFGSHLLKTTDLPANSYLPDTCQTAWQVLKTRSLSFYWATCLLPSDQAQRVAVLYAFCRQLDDLADDPNSNHSDLCTRFCQIRRDLQRGQSHDPIVTQFAHLASHSEWSFDTVDILLDALMADSQPRTLQTWSELVRYAYGVAGVIGLMMCTVLNVRQTQAYPFAVDLGIAMQLTNIARDVAEDAQQGRVYLPQCATEVPLSATAIHAGDPVTRQAAYAVMLQTLDLAELYYRSADQGMRYLPPRARLAIQVAARVYEAIGTVIRRDPARYWQRRAYVCRATKLRHTFQIMSDLLMQRDELKQPHHDPTLHTAISGWPGSDPLAGVSAVPENSQ